MAGLESLTPIGMGIDAAIQLFQSIYGVGQLISGNKGLENLKRPSYQVDSGIQYNRDLAAQIASEGLPSSAKNFYADSIDRGLGSTIAAVQGGGGNLGNVNQAFSTSTDAFRQLLAADATQKQKNQSVLMSANKDLAEENLRAFDYNKNQPYQLAYQKYTQQTNAGAQNLFGGLKGIGADAVAAGSGGNNEAMYQKFQEWMKTQNGGGGLYGF